MNYSLNLNPLKTLYKHKGFNSDFNKDNTYLEKAFDEIETLWLQNYGKIDTINFLLIAEAPLWGNDKKYIYNPDTNNSQFFYRSDLSDILKLPISNKLEFLQKCNDIGLLVIDISPFALNFNDTKINYKSPSLTRIEYLNLVRGTLPTYFEEKIKLVSLKKSGNVKVFFRYARVRNVLQDSISKVLIDYNFIENTNEIGYISKKGGGIDKQKLEEILATSIK